MITSADIAPFAGKIGGGFFLGVLVGYSIKKVIKLAAVIIGLFIAALAYLEYQRIVDVDWNRIQVVSQNGIAWVTDAIIHISNTISTTHSATLSHIGIPLASSASAGLMLGLAKG
jgi:uncharacterized membrane protein (Fun14 family)